MLNSTNRRKQKTVFVDIGIFAIRFCKNCLIFFTLKMCRIADSSEKCVACVENCRFYNLVFLEIVQWRKLEKNVNGWNLNWKIYTKQ